MANDNGGPSTLRKVGDLMRRPIERAHLETELARADAAEARALTAQYEAIEHQLEQVVRRVQEDPGDWVAIGEGDGVRMLTETEQESLRHAAVRASYENSHAIGYLRTLGRFVMGVGPTFTPELEDEDEALATAMGDWWDDFCELNHWEDFEDNFTHRTWRDGEAFVRQFVQPRTGRMVGVSLSPEVRRHLLKHNVLPSRLIQEAPIVEAGMVMIRFVAAEDVGDPDGKISHGIITAENDVQTVLGYMIQRDGKFVEVVPASEMEHVKIRADLDVKRGRSQLESILRRMRQYERWIDARINLSIVRSAVAFVKRIKSAQTPADVQQVRDAQTLERKTGPQTERRIKMLKGPTAIHAGPNIEYEFLAPNLQATDAQKDGRQIQLDMAASTGMPEYMFTGDASNANYSSTLVAESPAIREFESWRDFFEPHFKRIWRWVMVEAAKAKAIKGLTEKRAAEIDVSLEWPPLDVRDLLAFVQAQALMIELGILSKEGAANAIGIDWKTEKARVDDELEGALDFNFPEPPVEPEVDPVAPDDPEEPEDDE